MSRRASAAVALLALVAVLTGCRIDVAVDVVVDDDGSGTVTVTAVADAEVLSEVPGLADDVAVDDLREDGWEIEGPDPTADGGLRIVLRRGFDDLNELNEVLVNLGGPFGRVSVGREDSFARTGWAVDGVLRLDGGLSAFADQALVDAVRAVPYEDDLAARGLSLEQAVTITFSIRLPGSLTETTGIERRTDQGTVVTWTAPLDGSSMSVATLSERTDRGAEIANTTASVAQFLLVSWITLSLTFIGWVVFARHRRKRRRRWHDDEL
jgi:hypothetical protein